MMEMTDREIYTSWKTSKYPSEQVLILAELNDTDTRGIVEILHKMGAKGSIKIANRVTHRMLTAKNQPKIKQDEQAAQGASGKQTAAQGASGKQTAAQGASGKQTAAQSMQNKPEGEKMNDSTNAKSKKAKKKSAFFFRRTEKCRVGNESRGLSGLQNCRKGRFD